MDTELPRLKGFKALEALLGQHHFLIGLVAALIGTIIEGAAAFFNPMIRGQAWVSTGYEEYTTHTGALRDVLGVAPQVFFLAPSVIAALTCGPLARRFASLACGYGIPEVMLAVRRKGGKIPGHIAFIKLTASSLTIGSDGSAGREGPVVQVGTSIGSSLASSLRLLPSRVTLLASCGAAGDIAAASRTPLAGTVFVLKVILMSFSTEISGCVVISSVVASLIARALQGDEAVVCVRGDLALTHFADIWRVVILGLATDLTGLGFLKLLCAIENLIDILWEPLHPPEWSHPAVFGIILGLSLLVFPEMYGSGYPVQEAAVAGGCSFGSLLLLVLGRALYTPYTIGVGGLGGVFTSTPLIGAAVGATFGQFIASLTSTPATVFAAIGMGAAFAGAAHAPMTIMLIIVEMTEQYSLISPVMFAVVLATGISRLLTHATIYTEKLRRRGDTLDGPVDSMLLGPRPAREWMGQVPDSLLTSMSIGRAISKTCATYLSNLPVIDEDGRYLGFVLAIGLALAHQVDSGPDTPLSVLQLSAPSVYDDELPSVVSSKLHLANSSGLPVTDASAQIIDQVSQGDPIERTHRDRLRALAARTQSPLDSRWPERHERSTRSYHLQ